MKVEFESQGTHQLLTGPPGGSQQAPPLLTLPTACSPSPSTGSSTPRSSTLQLGEDEWAPRGNYILLPSQRQEEGEGISMH